MKVQHCISAIDIFAHKMSIAVVQADPKKLRVDKLW